MITKDINGSPLSPDYTGAVQSDNRSWQARLLKNGTEVQCSIKRIEITKGSSGVTDQFTTGAVIGSQLYAEVVELTDNLKLQEVEVQIGLDVNGSYEWIRLGYFTINDTDNTIYSTVLKGFGACVSKTGADFISPQDLVPPQPLTIANIIAQITVATGVVINVDASIDQSAEFTLPMSGITAYQALQAVAQAVGGYAVDSNEGEIDIKLFDDTPTITVNAGLMRRLPEVSGDNYGITGVAVNTASGLIKSSTPINYLGDAQWLTQAMFADYESALVGYTYRPATIELSLGDARLEGGDVLNVVDANGTTYAVPCHEVVHAYDGGFMSHIVSASAPLISNEIATPAPVSGQIQEAIDTANEALQAVADIGDTSQYFWHTTTDTGFSAGSHITQKPQQDVLADPTNAGGNTLLRSDGMTVRDGLVELASFTGNGAVVGKADTTHLVVSQVGLEIAESENVYLAGNILECKLLNDPTTGIALVWEYPYRAVANADGSVDYYVTLDIDNTGTRVGSVEYYDVNDPSITSSFDISTTQDDNGVYYLGNIIRQGKNFATQNPDYAVFKIIYPTLENVPVLKFGKTSDAKGNTSVAMGLTAGAYSSYAFAFGKEVNAYSNYCVAIGNGVIADSEGAFVIGCNNERDYNGKYAFIIGNGAGNNYSNAFAVKWDGIVSARDKAGTFSDIFDLIYPVGSYYETSDGNFDPNNVWTGTWDLETEGQVHVSAGTNYTVAGALTNTTDGGEEAHLLTHTESGVPAHTHSFTQPTIYGKYKKTCASGSNQNRVDSDGTSETRAPYRATGGAVGAVTGGAQDATDAHNNMQPYIVVYRWHRTA